MPSHLSAAEQKQVQTVIDRARGDRTVPHSAQESIPFQRMFPDGICRVTDNYYTKTIQFQDINYQLAQQEDQTAIFEEWCSFLNFFDSSIRFELSFMNMATDASNFEKMVRIPYQKDHFNPVRTEYSTMLRRQLAQGNNGLTKTKYLTFGIEAESMKQAKPRLIHIEIDLMNNFKRLGVRAKLLNGKERLHLMHDMFHMGDHDRFNFDWKWLPESGLSVKDFIAPTGFAFPKNRIFQMGGMYGSMSYLQITASDLSDQLLKDFLDMESSQIVTMHIQSVDQNKAIKSIKHTITELDRSKIEEQKKAVRSGYDMDIIPSDLATYGKDAKALLKELQSQNERMFLLTFLVMNTGETEQELETNVFQASSIAQKYNCNLRRLDFQQEQGLMSCLPLAQNLIEIQRSMTTSSTAIFVPFTTQELFQTGKEALYYGLNALSNNLIMVDRKKLKNPNGLILGTPGKDKYISIAALEATLANGEKEGEEKSTVTSDYAAIMPMIQGFKAIAYTDESKIVTENTCKPELYKTAKEAIENVYTVPAQYNGGSIELADLLCIHHVENFGEEITATDHGRMTLAEAAQLYNLTLKFEPVHYISGDNDTEENAYSKLEEDGTFTPCYVNDKEESVVIPEGSTEKIGRSAIGRRPAVLVKLVDAANNVVLAGYIKLEITEKAATPDAIVIDKSTPQLPYLCGDQAVSITWKDMSGKILEELGMTKEEFTKGYTFVKDETYVADGKGGFIQVTAANKFAVDNAYGVVKEIADAEPSSTNDILTWTTTREQRDQLIKDYKDRTLTLYGKYKPVAGGTTYAIYVGIKISIAELPTTASYGNKRDAYWYPAETALADRDTVRTNVPAPDANNNVTAYVKNLDDYFWHIDATSKKEVSGIEFTVSEASKPVYGEIWNKKDKGMEIKYSYLFSAKNDGLTIGGKKLFVSKDETKKNESSTNLYWGEKRADASLIATLKVSHKITYKDNAEAKKFLNLFGHNENKPNQQFAIIEVSAVYGDCNIELAPAYNFNARFLRPLDIESNDNAKFVDAEAGGSSVKLGDLFTAEDWRDKAVIKYNTTTKAYEAVLENGVNLYTYYQIEKVALDLDNATCDVNTSGTQMPINPDVIKLSILDNAGAATTSNEVTISGDDIAKLNTYKLNYKNNEGNTKDFTIMVPVKVTYAWGEVEAAVAIAVKGTIANR